jgi:hypothetical protein
MTTPNRDEGEAELEVPADMAERSGLRASVARSDEHLSQRPEELLARLARVTRLCAISDALIFPESPSLHARWSRDRERWVSRTTGEPVDAIALRDRSIHFHRGGESEPTAIVPFRKVDDLVQTLLALEELERFRRLSSVQVAQSELDGLTSTVRELAASVESLRVLRSEEPPERDSGERGTVEPTSLERAPVALVVLSQVDEQPDEGLEELERLERERLSDLVEDLDLLPRGERTVAHPYVDPLLVEAPGARTLPGRLLGALDLERRDVGSLVWLSIAAIVSFGTTWHGAASLGLAPELALTATVFVCGFLWTLLVGLAMTHDPARKLTAELVLASACVYCGFFTYYDGMTRETRSTVAEERAARAHLELVGALYSGHAAELERLRGEAVALDAAKVSEIADGGSSTGRAGYGPEARRLASAAGAARLAAARLEGEIAPLEALVDLPIDGLTPDEVHLRDLALWSAAPPDWRSMPAPSRELYVDVEAPTSPVYLPIRAVRAGEPEAYVALGCALVVEGVMIWCGMAIERRKRERLLPRVTRAGTRIVRELRDARCSLEHATRETRAAPRYAYRELDDEEDRA